MRRPLGFRIARHDIKIGFILEAKTVFRSLTMSLFRFRKGELNVM